MSDDLLFHRVPVTKLEAAQRQLHTAIELFFNKGDFVAVHTLASAAATILHDVAGHRKVFRPFDLIRKERQLEVLRAVREPQNFFKHGDKDPDAVLPFAPSHTHFMILDAVWNGDSLGLPASPERTVYSVWFAMHYPELINWKAAPPWLLNLRDGLDDFFDPLDPLDLKLFTKLLTRQRLDAKRSGGGRTVSATGVPDVD
jgi:hypothetical protein